MLVSEVKRCHEGSQMCSGYYLKGSSLISEGVALGFDVKKF